MPNITSSMFLKLKYPATAMVFIPGCTLESPGKIIKSINATHRDSD